MSIGRQRYDTLSGVSVPPDPLIPKPPLHTTNREPPGYPYLPLGAVETSIRVLVDICLPIGVYVDRDKREKNPETELYHLRRPGVTTNRKLETVLDEWSALGF